MRWAIFAGLLFMSLSGLAYSGVIPISSLLESVAYDREVEAPVSRVAAALGDVSLDRLANAGSRQSSRVEVRTSRTADGLTWPVVVNGKTMINLHARLDQAGEGRTRVRSWAERAPDYDSAIVPMGFQSVANLNSFMVVLMETELNEFGPAAERLGSEEIRQRQGRAYAQLLAAEIMSDPTMIMREAEHRMDAMAPPRGSDRPTGWGAGQPAPQRGGRWEAGNRGWGNKQ